MSIVTGEYNHKRYRILLDGKEIYRAGNCRWESSTIVPPFTKEAVDLETMERYCKGTAAEIAEEENAELGKIKRKQFSMNDAEMGCSCERGAQSPARK